MADSLLGFQSAMNGIPDNTSALISPQNAREAWLSLTQDRGVAIIDPVAGPPPITIPLALNVWTDIPQAIIAGGGGMEIGALPLFWRMDANGHLYYDYAADWPTTFVPPGYLRQVVTTAIIEANLAGANDLYEFAISEAGVPLPPFFAIEEATSQEVILVEITTAQSTEVAAADRISVQVRNTSSAAGLDIHAFGFLTQGGPPA